MSQPIRVVVVDDSPLMRRFIAGLLEQDPAIRVVGFAGNGREAIALVEQLHPDVVTMDVRMPIMDGVATTEHLMAYCPTPILVLTASLAGHDIDITFKMLGAGALEVVEKPNGGDPKAIARAGQDLIRRVKLLARVKVVTHLRGRRRAPEALTAQHEPPAAEHNGAPAGPAGNGSVAPAARHARGGFPVIVIGASTGGPRVVHQILGALPPRLGAAIVVVQHIAEGFSGGMAEWLATNCKLPVALASEGAPVRANHVLVAPDRRDWLLTNDGHVHLSQNALLLQRPSVDVAMQAAAEVFGPRVIGVLLTGMGRDGAYGMLTIRRSGGYTIAQDESSSTIFGMPRAAIELGAACEVLPAAQIAARLIDLVAATQRSGAPERGGA